MTAIVRGVGIPDNPVLAQRAFGGGWLDSIFELFRSIGRFFRHLGWMCSHLHHRVSAPAWIYPSHQALDQYFNTSSFFTDFGRIKMPEEKSLLERYWQIMQIDAMKDGNNTVFKYLGAHLRKGTCYGQTLAIAYALHHSPQSSFKEVLAQMTQGQELPLIAIRFHCAVYMLGTLQRLIEAKEGPKEAAKELRDAITTAQPPLPRYVVLAALEYDGGLENQQTDRPLDRLMEPLEKEDAPEGVYLLNMVSAKQGHTITVRMKAGEYAFYDIWNTGGYLFKDKQTFLKALKSHLQNGLLETYFTPNYRNLLVLERIEV